MLIRIDTPIQFRTEIGCLLKEQVNIVKKRYTAFLSNPEITSMLGKEAGEVLEVGLIPANKPLILDFGIIANDYHNILVSVNPMLYKYCEVNSPSMLPSTSKGSVLDPGPTGFHELIVNLTAKKRIDLSVYDWIVCLSVIE